MSRIRYGKRYCHDSPSIEEKRLQQEILNALKGILGNQDVFIRQIIKEYEELLCKMPDKDDVEAMKQEVENLKLKATSQIMQGMNENVPAELLDVKIEELSHKAKEIEIRMKQVGEKEVLENVYKERRKELEDVLHQLNGIALEWNEDMIRTVIDSIDVIDSTEIMITLKSGHVIQHTWEVKKK